MAVAVAGRRAQGPAAPAFKRHNARRGWEVLPGANTLIVNALNKNAGGEAAALAQARRWIIDVAPGRVGGIHLAGHDAGTDIVIDDHGSAVSKLSGWADPGTQA